ncbi:LemA family protein [Gottschalkia acidurici 9a]|uniref:LemA family protein n=1 Tax=Gottschalkia acidurici (strain ATCC 7906 / DSM 604 / BCRC 14475 / CIP 104303 / KCTC 5404 / NCIMB 10678 / 9a) TaxID=1128398 RepID=K0B016_GOTA9|nr:LemA family protein [Gottschalkia acidurici]AFS77961.1 LemA family protein [Gottschalkia acidurici 9a]
MKKISIPLIIILAIVLLCGGVLASSYNNLVQLDETTSAQWAQVENQLKRRADLIPNLVNTVKGFAQQEKDVLIGVTEARSGLEKAKTPGEMAQANDQLNTALSRLNVVVERYPELKSDQNFIRLQDELAGTENRITVARQDYNSSVKEFNTKIKSFPTRIIAGMFGFEEAEYFEVQEKDKETPKVEF